MRLRSELIEGSSYQDSNIEIGDMIAYNNSVAKFTTQMKEVDITTMYMQRVENISRPKTRTS